LAKALTSMLKAIKLCYRKQIRRKSLLLFIFHKPWASMEPA
jgi:hypothetical protein